MADDFGYAWRTVRLYCPSAPTFLARAWVNAAWKQLLAARRWGFMRGETTFVSDGSSPYLICPPDFGSFKVVVDPGRQVRLCTTHSLDDLAARDPLTRGQARYRYYPSGSPSTLSAIYHRQGDRLDDTDIFTGVLADGGEVLIAGALAHAAGWPGTPDKPNPYFNATLAESKTREFALGVQMLSLRDDEQYPDDLWDSWPEADCDCLGGGADPRTTDASYV
jgi:hypothetical protein